MDTGWLLVGSMLTPIMLALGLAACTLVGAGSYGDLFRSYGDARRNGYCLRPLVSLTSEISAAGEILDFSGVFGGGVIIQQLFSLSQAGPQVSWGVGVYLVLREFHFYGALFFALQYKAVYVIFFKINIV